MTIRVRVVFGSERTKDKPATLWERAVEIPERPLIRDYLLLDIGPTRFEFVVGKVTWDESAGQYVVDAGVVFLTNDDYDKFVSSGLWTPTARH